MFIWKLGTIMLAVGLNVNPTTHCDVLTLRWGMTQSYVQAVEPNVVVVNESVLVEADDVVSGVPAVTLFTFGDDGLDSVSFMATFPVNTSFMKWYSILQRKYGKSLLFIGTGTAPAGRPTTDDLLQKALTLNDTMGIPLCVEFTVGKRTKIHLGVVVVSGTEHSDGSATILSFERMQGE